MRTRSRFRLADCADDAAALLDVLGTGPVIAVGYSMGGPIAQLLWRRHRDLVDGLVLCATAADFLPTPLARHMSQTMMFGVAGAARAAAFSRVVPNVPMLGLRTRTMPAWIAAELRRHDWRMIFEAGHSICTYHAQRWINEVDVPTAVMCTAYDRAVSPSLQLATADAIRNASVHRIAAGHLACARPQFGAELTAACTSVADRVYGGRRIARRN